MFYEFAVQKLLYILIICTVQHCKKIGLPSWIIMFKES